VTTVGNSAFIGEAPAARTGCGAGASQCDPPRRTRQPAPRRGGARRCYFTGLPARVASGTSTSRPFLTS
jgi:hypothetical protein